MQLKNKSEVAPCGVFDSNDVAAVTAVKTADMCCNCCGDTAVNINHQLGHMEIGIKLKQAN